MQKDPPLRSKHALVSSDIVESDVEEITAPVTKIPKRLASLKQPVRRFVSSPPRVSPFLFFSSALLTSLCSRLLLLRPLLPSLLLLRFLPFVDNQALLAPRPPPLSPSRCLPSLLPWELELSSSFVGSKVNFVGFKTTFDKSASPIKRMLICMSRNSPGSGEPWRIRSPAPRVRIRSPTPRVRIDLVGNVSSCPRLSSAEGKKIIALCT